MSKEITNETRSHYTAELLKKSRLEMSRMAQWLKEQECPYDLSAYSKLFYEIESFLNMENSD